MRDADVAKACLEWALRIAGPDNGFEDALAALARLVAAAERTAELEREVEAANFDGHWDAKVAAEAERDAALAEVAEWKAEAERSKWPKEAAQEYHRMKVDLPAALARVEQLEAALREIEHMIDIPAGAGSHSAAMRDVARAALGGPEGRASGNYAEARRPIVPLLLFAGCVLFWTSLFLLLTELP